MFRKNEFLELTTKEARQYYKYLKDLFEEKDNYYWYREASDEVSFLKAIKNIPMSKKIAMRSGFGGDAKDVFQLLEKKYNFHSM